MQLTSIDPKQVKTELLIVPVCKNKDIHDDKAIFSLITKTKKFKEFKGEKGDELVLYDLSGINAKRVMFAGLGELKKIDSESLRALSGKAVKAGIKRKLSEISLIVPSAKKISISEQEILEAMMEGVCLGNHLFDRYKKKKKNKPVKKIDLFVNADLEQKFSDLPQRVETICDGTILAREWVSAPSNDKTPEKFVKTIVSEAEKTSLEIKIMEEKELKQQKFGAMLAVAKGSENKPALTIFEHNPKDAKQTIVFVGKGVTFDSGGINLKPSTAMEDMKMDMAGAAAVAATLITVAKLQPTKRIIGVMPIVENMPSGSAFRPGDIIKTYDGKTVEIGNTDAEGRLILIDAMSYAIKTYKPNIIIDVATLTGACVVALGEKIAGVFSFDDKLAEAIVQSSEKTFERCWRLPLPDDYKELLKSDFADFNNISSSRWGGAITAALFLAEFVNDAKWAHIDIAGPAYIKKEDAYCCAGGTGFGVRLFCDLIDNTI